MQTTIESRSRTVVIGDGAPFCVIGERINPTGRKAFQVQLQAGDLSQLEIDVAEQVAGGADVLDVNVGDPLADEIELMRAAVPMVQGLTDLPLCIDSSIIEALEAGLGAYEGKALVNSVTGEDERLSLILPIVARHGAAVIGLANDDEIPMEPERRLEVARKIVSAAGDHGIPPEDVVIDPLAMPVGAEPRAVTLFLETVRLIRDAAGREHDLRRQQHLVRAARPPHPGRRLPGSRQEPRTDQRDHGRALSRVRRVGACHRLPARPGRVGRPLDRRAPREAGGAGRAGSDPVAHMAADAETIQPGTGRVRLTFAPDGGEVRVPAGTTVFDGASWNGIAIDSTCGGHGTCKKCKVRITDGEVPIDTLDPRAFSPDELRGGWRLACRAIATHDLGVEVPPLQTRPKAALVGVGRHVILRPSVQKRYLELEEPSLEDQVSDMERVVAAVDDFELRVELGAARGIGRTLRSSNYKVTAVICDDVLIDVEPGDTTERRHAIAFDLGTTTVVATLLDLGHRPAAGGALDAEPPAAVRRRRDLARIGHDDGPGRAGDAAAAGA